MKKLISLVLMLVAISHATAQAPTSTKVLSDFGNSSTHLRIEKQIVEDSPSNDVTPSDKANSEAESSLLADGNSNTYTFQRVTHVTSGKRYMIVASVSGKYYAASSKVKQSDDNSTDVKAVQIVINDETISNSNESLIFTIEGDLENGYTIKQPNGLYWQNASNSSVISLKELGKKNDYVSWNITFGDYIANIINKATGRNIALYSSRKKTVFIASLSKSKSPTLYEEIETPSHVIASVSSVGYATLYYSDLSLQVPKGVIAMTYAYDNGTKNLFKSKTYEAGSVIPKGVAVVLKAPEGDYTFMVSDEAGEAPEKTNLYGYDIEATTSVDGMSKYYMLSLNAINEANSVGFYWGNDDGTGFNTGAHKAFLALPESAAAAKGYAFEDIVDGISSVSMADDSSDAPVFSLMGIRMAGKLPAGIYVRKGKKFIVR